MWVQQATGLILEPSIANQPCAQILALYDAQLAYDTQLASLSVGASDEVTGPDGRPVPASTAHLGGLRIHFKHPAARSPLQLLQERAHGVGGRAWLGRR